MKFNFNQNLPRQAAQVGKHSIYFYTFECDKKMLEDQKFFNLAVVLTMGTNDERKFGPAEIEVDMKELLVQTTLCANKKQAKKLLQNGSIGIGEPSTGIKKFTEHKLVVKDPLNALITLNRAGVDWTFITF